MSIPIMINSKVAEYFELQALVAYKTVAYVKKCVYGHDIFISCELTKKNMLSALAVDFDYKPETEDFEPGELSCEHEFIQLMLGLKLK